MKVTLTACDRDSSAGYVKSFEFDTKEQFLEQYKEFEAEVQFRRWYVEVEDEEFNVEVQDLVESWIDSY